MPEKDFDCRKIISDAWAFTQEHKTLMRWYSFFPSILTTLVGILYFAYQFFAFKQSPLFGKSESESFLHQVIAELTKFFSAHGNLLWPAIITSAVIILLYLLLPTLCQGGLIQVISKMRKGEPAKPIDGISYGLITFLPLFEFHTAVRSFSLFGVLTEVSFVVRNLGPSALQLLLPIFALVAFVGFVLTLLFTYSDFFIVLKKEPILNAMGKSAKLMILNWQHTFLVGILMLIISLRVLFNVVAVLLVPALIIFSAGFAATASLSKIGIGIGFSIGFVALIFTAYFNGILNMFANTVWTFTFVHFIEEKRTHEMMPS